MPSIEAVSTGKFGDGGGTPTVEVALWAGRILGRAAAASGASTGAHEPPAFPKGGVNEAVTVFRGEVAPRITGHDADDQTGLDRALRQVDGTRNFSHIGANVATAVSIANAKVAAASAGEPLFRYLGGLPGACTACPFRH